jgi:putative ABC transport system permease protein
MLNDFGFVPAGFTTQWHSWILASSMGTGVIIALCGVLAASGRATRVRPLEALRESSTATRVMTASRWALGVLFLAGAVAMLILVPAVGGDAALSLSILVSMVLVVAFAALAPLIVPLVSWPLRFLASGQLGQLAYANLRTGVRRSASTAAPIMVLVAFVAGLAGTLDTVDEASRQELLRTMRGDLVVTAEQSVSADLAAVEGVAAVSEEVPISFDVSVDGGDGDISDEAVEAMAVDPTSYLRTHQLVVGSGNLADLQGDTIAISTGGIPGFNASVGDTVPVRFGDQTRDLRVVAVLPATLIGPYALLPLDFQSEASGPRSNVVELVPGLDPSTVASQLARYGDTLTVPEWIRQHANEQQRESLNVGIALLGMAMVYTVLAMINAVVISASDRRVEFATARVTGLTRGQVVRTALVESVAVVVIGLLLGGLAAAGSVLGIAKAVADLTGITVIGIQWPLLAALAGGAAVVVATTSVVTTLSATRTPAIRLVGSRE